MAWMNCSGCGKAFSDRAPRCPHCGLDPKRAAEEARRAADEAAREREQELLQLAQAEEEARAAKKREEEISRVLVTTTPCVEGYRVTRHVGVVSSEGVVGESLWELFREIAAGGSALRAAKVFRGLRHATIRGLQEEAHGQGANAVVGVDFDLGQLSKDGYDMYYIVANGTAVWIVPADERGQLEA